MMLRQLLATRVVQAALGVVAASATLAAVAVGRALSLEEMPVASRELPLSFATLESGPRTPAELIEQAVAAAPFAPNRRPNASRAQSSVSAPTMVDDTQLQLVGTVVDSTAGSFVLMTVPGQGTKVVRPDQVVGGLRLRSIEPGSATFTRVSDGDRVVLRVPRSR